MRTTTSKRALTIPRKLAFTALGCVLACSSTPAEPAPDAAVADAGLVDGCVYQLCSSPTDAASCPGVVCLPPTEQCPPGCEPVV
jgi:hypothetical protein